MLLCLRVSHFAIIDHLEVEFGAGLNVVTGETGAGKSILVSALQLVLGGRAKPEVVRTGAESAEVEALFDISDHKHVRKRLAELEIEAGDELVLRRMVTKTGRSRAYINGRMASAAQLASLAAGLCDISSQHEHHTLIDAQSHLRYLDAFGGLNETRRAMGEVYRSLAEHARKLDEVENASKERMEREDLLRFQVQEIEALDLQPGEDESMTEERDRNRHAEKLAQLTVGAEEALYSQDDALCPMLSRVIHMVQEASTMDASLSPLADQLLTAQAQLEDAARELGSYASSVSTDPERLQEIEERLHALSRLRRKYGQTIDEILEHCARAKEELSELDQSEERIEALEKALKKAKGEAGKVAQELSKARRTIAGELGKRITAELASLSMGDAEVRVDVDNPKGQDGDLDVGGARLSASGIDRVEFLIATNRGEAPQPLHKIASGGELSRAMLAIKRVLAGVGPGGLYVFDEVDSGVGGAVAEVIGRKVKEVSVHHQVLCITHLPQIAAFADSHFHVRKAVEEGRTHSRIDRLTKAEQQEELARMIGGIKITSRTRAAAKEMLTSATAA